jgi:hypothetical protein
MYTLLSTTLLGWSRSNIPSLIVTSQFCSILPGGTATGSASDSARTRSEPATSSGARPPSRAAARRKRKLIRRQTKVQTVGPLARNRGFESISLRQRVHLRQVNFAVAAGKALRLRLIEDGLLRAGDCNGNSFPAAAIDYGAVQAPDARKGLEQLPRRGARRFRGGL